MAVMVGTTDGYHTFASSGDRDHALAGRAVDALTPGPAGTWVAIVDGRAVWTYTDGDWTELATGAHDLVSLTTAGDSVFAGTNDARMLEVDGHGLVALTSFDRAPSRDEWHQVGSPIQVRSLTATCDGATVLANVHVGGVLRSTDAGRSWLPTMPVDNDVHEVSAHPDRPEVVLAAAAVGLLRSFDGGATWAQEVRGLAGTYCRAVSSVGDDLYVSNAAGPFSKESALFRSKLDGGPLEPVGDGLPETVDGMIDTRFVTARNGTVALVSRAGEVWARPRGDDSWRHLASAIGHITCVAAS